MTRRQFVNMIYAQTEGLDWGLVIKRADLVRMVEKYKTEHKTFLSYCTPVVKDGVLYINGDFVGRIAPKDVRPWSSFTEEGTYYESLCIRDCDS